MFEVSEAPRLHRGLARLVLAPPPEVWGGFVTVRIANLRLPADSTTTRSDLELPAGACPLVETAVAGSHRVLRGSEIVRQAAAAGQEEIEVHVLSGGERAAANLTALGVPMEFAVAVAAVEKQLISAPQPRAAERGPIGPVRFELREAVPRVGDTLRLSDDGPEYTAKKVTWDLVAGHASVHVALSKDDA